MVDGGIGILMVHIKNREDNTMKKIILVAIMCSIFLMGCAQKEQTKLGEQKIGEISEDKIVGTLGGVSDYAVSYPDIPALAEESEVIVYGEVVDVHYILGENGAIYTNEEVKILQPLKGEYKENETIIVGKDQGYATVEAYINSFESEELRELERQDYEQYEESEWDEIYIKQEVMHEVMSEIGQKGVFFLIKSAFYDEDNSYCPLTGPDGEYLEIEENKFAQMKEYCMVQEEVALTNEETEENNIETQSLEEIISAIR